MELGLYVTFAERLADIARDVVVPYFRNIDQADVKADQSPVTVADKEVESRIREAILENYPDHGVIGEEHDRYQEGADWVWTIDPIDGTTSFMIGRPLFGTLLSLTYQGIPVLGMIDQPILKERWLATATGGTTLNGKAISCRACPSLDHAVLATTGPDYFSDLERQRFLSVAEKARHVVYGGDCYNYGLLSLGSLDLVVESQLKVHDFCALKVIVEGAGGLCTDWQGKPLGLDSDGTVVAAASQALHQEVLALLHTGST